MAAHESFDDYEYHTISLTALNTARGVDGPQGSKELQGYISTAAATVYAQTGPQVDGVTDISANGAPCPVGSWFEIDATRIAAPKAGSALGATVFFQTDTNPTSITLRFVPKGA